MITVGYGDIKAINEYEQLLAIIVMMMACGIFGYIMSNVIFKIFIFLNKFKNNKDK